MTYLVTAPSSHAPYPQRRKAFASYIRLKRKHKLVFCTQCIRFCLYHGPGEGTMENERYPYWPLPERPPIRWPNGAQIAFWVIPNVEHFRFDKPGGDARGFPDVYNFAQRDYGSRAGIWRMMDVMDRYGVRGTVALNSDVCRFYPQIIRAGVDRKWEWMGHGVSNSEPLIGLDESAERALIRNVVDTITDATG